MFLRDLDALKEKPFRWQFAAQSASVLGDQIAPIALAFAVLDQTGSATDLGLVLLARQVPLALVVLAAGVWADRLPRNRMMFAADWTRFGTQALLAVLVMAGHATLWHFLALQAVNGCATALFQPAATGLTPLTVSRDRLQQANALMSLTISVAVVVGPIVGGIIVATVGPGWGLAVDSATFAASAVCLMQVRIPKRVLAAKPQNMLADLAAGWREIGSRRWLLLGIIDLSLFQMLVYSTYFVLGPLIAKQHLGGSASWGLIVTMWGVGAALGGVMALRFTPRRPIVMALFPLAAVTPSMILLGLAPSLAAVAVTAIPAGAAMVFSSVYWDTTLQREVPEGSLSRVSAYDWAGSMALRPAGYAAVGPIAAAISARWTLIGAALILLTAQLATLFSSSVRAVRGVPDRTT
ncbi:MAG: MFS transporter [Solirubrobacterales bacterium]